MTAEMPNISPPGQPAPTAFVPKLTAAMVWKRKEKFLLYEDTYHDWVLFAVEEGSFHYEIADQQGTAAFGDLVLCPPRTPFRRVIITPLTFHFLRFVWEDAEGNAIDPGDAIPVGKISLKDSARLAANYGWLSAAKMRTPAGIGLVNHFLRDLWLMYCRETTGMQRAAAGEAGDPTMAKALEQLKKRAFQPFNLQEVAAALGLTPVQFSKRFKKAFGETPIDCVTRLRLEKARTLLTETRLTLEQISECCGYANGFYLHRVFVKHMHTTPSQYRKAHRV